MTPFDGEFADRDIDEGLRSLARQAEGHEPRFSVSDICSRPRWPSHLGGTAVAASLLAVTVALSFVVVQAARGHQDRPAVGTSTTTTRLPNIAFPEVDQVHFSSASVGWAAAEHSSRLLMTTDGGTTWRDVSPPALEKTGHVLGGGLAGGFFLSASDFWVSVISDADGLSTASLMHTTNAGKTWSKAASFPDCDGNIWVVFAPNGTGWVEVGNGQAAMSEAVTIYDMAAGGHWSVLSRSATLTGGKGTKGGPTSGGDKTGLGLSGTAGSGVPTLWLTGSSAGTFLVSQSTDGGRTWSRLTFPGVPSAGGIAYPPVFAGAQLGSFQAWYGTSHGSVAVFYATADGGHTWNQHRSPSPVARQLLDVETPSIWLAASGSTLYRTPDGGGLWSHVVASIDLGSSGGSGQLDFVNTHDGWAVLGNQTLWRTTDGGRVWMAVAVRT